MSLAIIGRFGVTVAYNSGAQYATELIPTCVRGQGVAAGNLNEQSIYVQKKADKLILPCSPCYRLCTYILQFVHIIFGNVSLYTITLIMEK